ncbi:MAG: hypothetical protein M5R42_10485 [Rhodocyclaceae bacterium]|nr:hypothetical protein [Rhodocyclaceae bacterium]
MCVGRASARQAPEVGLKADLQDRGGSDKELTQTGRELAKLPLDPRIGRMMLAARDGHCLREMLVIAAALSVQDPRERPQEQAGAADQAHAKWRGNEQQQRSEFLAWLNLWQAFGEVWTHESQRKQRDWCRRHFLNSPAHARVARSACATPYPLRRAQLARE